MEKQYNMEKQYEFHCIKCGFVTHYYFSYLEDKKEFACYKCWNRIPIKILFKDYCNNYFPEADKEDDEYSDITADYLNHFIDKCKYFQEIITKLNEQIQAMKSCRNCRHEHPICKEQPKICRTCNSKYVNWKHQGHKGEKNVAEN